MKLVINSTPRKAVTTALLALLLVTAGCVSGDRTAPEPPAIAYPQTWERLDQVQAQSPRGQCAVDNGALADLLEAAVERNTTIQTLHSQMAEARLGVVVARADRFPSLGASFAAGRQETGTPTGSATSNRFTLSADAQVEVDVWGKLSSAQQRAQLLYRTAEFDYQNARRVVLGDVSRAWYTAIFARDLANVFERRVISVRNNLEIVEQSYKQGINSALDVYLARTSYSQEQSRLARQNQAAQETIAALQLLLTEYPSGNKLLAAALPALGSDDASMMPSALLQRRPDIQSAWTRLLAQDAAVAVAHKQRFPRFIVSAGLDDVDSRVGDILDGDNVLWSVLAAVTQPVFQAGRLKALEDQSRERLEQSELAYIGTLQRAFGEVENALSNRRSLRQQLEASERAEDAANAAYELSFQQYQRGLVDYTTVLQAEQRAFDATSSLLELRYQQLINRVDLCTALGGEGVSR
jgi:NodT family efflux transporter outer membrane factor (OMF) lipoprotein